MSTLRRHVAVGTPCLPALARAVLALIGKKKKSRDEGWGVAVGSMEMAYSGGGCWGAA